MDSESVGPGSRIGCTTLTGGWRLEAGGTMPFNTGEQLTSQVHITHQVILSKTESCWCLDHCPPSLPPPLRWSS